jgi:hypothetical protein
METIEEYGLYQDWCAARVAVRAAAAQLERARALLRARANKPGLAPDWMLAQEMADFAAVVADGAWSLGVQIVKAERQLAAADAAAVAGAENVSAIQPERSSRPRY